MGDITILGQITHILLNKNLLICSILKAITS
jgi:hypothetical protein